MSVSEFQCTSVTDGQSKQSWLLKWFIVFHGNHFVLSYSNLFQLVLWGTCYTSWWASAMSVMRRWEHRIRNVTHCLTRAVLTVWSCSQCSLSSATSWMASDLSVASRAVSLSTNILLWPSAVLKLTSLQEASNHCFLTHYCGEVCFFLVFFSSNLVL